LQQLGLYRVKKKQKLNNKLSAPPAEGWRKLHNEEVHNFYSSPNIIRTIKSGTRWVGREECIQYFGGKATRKETTWNTVAGGRIILRWILRR
jgi:hypothetical protein